MTRKTDYTLGFTAASLRPELMRVMAEVFAEAGDWTLTKERVLSANLLQANSHTTLLRFERELRGRLKTLTYKQLRLLITGQQEDRLAMSWLASVKKYPFLLHAAQRLLRPRLDVHEEVLHPSDLEAFMKEEADIHPQLKTVSESSRGKIRRVLLSMLRELGVLTPGPGLGRLQSPYLPPESLQAVLEDDPVWLCAFLRDVPTRRAAHA